MASARLQQGMTIPEARQWLARQFGVEPDNIEITIRA
jgi:hypothetical protein